MNLGECPAQWAAEYCLGKWAQKSNHEKTYPSTLCAPLNGVDLKGRTVKMSLCVCENHIWKVLVSADRCYH